MTHCMLIAAGPTKKACLFSDQNGRNGTGTDSLRQHTRLMNVKGSMRRAPPGNVVTLQPGTRGRSMPHRTPLN
jgi:hypothetical protein